MRNIKLNEQNDASPIMITLQQIRDNSPCANGWKKVLVAKGPDMSARFPLAEIIETNGFDDTLWCLRCLPEYNNLWRKYAVWCARQVQHLMTDQCSLDALDVAWRHSEGLATDEELNAAWATARVAAWDAAWATAWVAAWDAAWAAARDAAWATAWAAARVAVGVDAGAAAGAAAGALQEDKLQQILAAGAWVE